MLQKGSDSGVIRSESDAANGSTEQPTPIEVLQQELEEKVAGFIKNMLILAGDNLRGDKSESSKIDLNALQDRLRDFEYVPADEIKAFDRTIEIVKSFYGGEDTRQLTITTELPVEVKDNSVLELVIVRNNTRYGDNFTDTYVLSSEGNDGRYVFTRNRHDGNSEGIGGTFRHQQSLEMPLKE